MKITSTQLALQGWRWVIDFPQEDLIIFEKELFGSCIYCELKKGKHKMISKMSRDKYLVKTT